MQTWWSPMHRRHRPAQELIDGRLADHVEVPERAELVLAAVRDAEFGPVEEVVVVAADVRAFVEAVHDPAFVSFLASAWDEWTAEGRTWDALPLVWPVPAFGGTGPVPDVIDGKLSWYSFDAGTPIGEGTWAAVEASAACALAAAEDVRAGAGASFALCRPPGHHAARAAYGGYCYLNNTAAAAARLGEDGSARVAVLDVDYHHGNGTQTIFAERDDVLTVSIHADPRQEYPYFLGHASESGPSNLNLPLPWGTGWDDWSAALDVGCQAVRDFGAERLVVALGVDTHADDPISRFGLRTADYPVAGARVAALGLPTVVVLEGGYATVAIGANVTGFLAGFVACSRPYARAPHE